jgi:hypothetical protein
MPRKRKKQSPAQRKALARLLLAQRYYLKSPTAQNLKAMKIANKAARAIDATTVYEDV